MRAAGRRCADIARPESPQLVAELPLPHFENEDVDLCGTTLIVVNDREAEDLDSVLYSVKWAAYWSPTDPTGQTVHTADAYRGIDVLRIDGGGLTSKKVAAPVPGSWFGSPTLDAGIFQPHPVFGFVCPVLA
jgi:hypothetical protein